MIKMLYFICLFSVLIAVTAGKGMTKSRKPYSIELESELRVSLFRNYSLLQRPAKDVEVSVSLSLFTINDLSIKDQSLSFAGSFTIEWNDTRLFWENLDDYASVAMIFDTELRIWRPSIIIENAVSDISVVTDPQEPMRIMPIGHVTWSPAGLHKISCESDITYYPLDQQYCTLLIRVSAYTTDEVALVPGEFPVDTGSYVENGEWEVIGDIEADTRESMMGRRTFSGLTFGFRLRRRLIFHALNTLFPVALLAFLIPLVFVLHVDSGEKIGYSLTVLLAYAVYLSVISENIPSTSMSVCYLSVYLAFILVAAALSVFCTILVINCHQQQENDVPGWLKTLTLNVFATFAFCYGSRRRCHSCKQSCKTKSKVEDVSAMKISGGIYSDDLTWQEVSRTLDSFFFTVFMSFVVAASITFAMTICNYYFSIH